METTRPVVVKNIPEKLGSKEARAFLRDVQRLVTMDRPQLVFDFSRVRRFEAAGLETLLECMSEVMKHDGDLKLASLSPEAAVVLELTRTDRLFEIYDTAADAVRSFTRFMPHAMRNQPFKPAGTPETANSPASSPSSPQPKTDAVA
jgi:anti-sigma B factor antagonist